jgi:hypothetical protein
MALYAVISRAIGTCPQGILYLIHGNEWATDLDITAAKREQHYVLFELHNMGAA